MSKNIYTIPELAEILKVEAHLIRRLIKGEQLEAFKVGGVYRVTGRALEKFIEENKTGGKK